MFRQFVSVCADDDDVYFTIKYTHFTYKVRKNNNIDNGGEGDGSRVGLYMNATEKHEVMHTQKLSICKSNDSSKSNRTISRSNSTECAIKLSKSNMYIIVENENMILQKFKPEWRSGAYTCLMRCDAIQWVRKANQHPHATQNCKNAEKQHVSTMYTQHTYSLLAYL